MSFVNHFALVLPLSVAAACTAPAEERPLPPDDLPLVEGLVPAEDEDPRIDAVRYTLGAQTGALGASRASGGTGAPCR